MQSLKPRSTITQKQLLELVSNIVGGAAFACLFFGLLMIDQFIHNPLIAGA